MQVVHVSLSNLLAISNLQEKVIAIFYPSWKNSALEKAVSSLAQYPAHNVTELFAVLSEGDDGVETFVVDSLKASDFPYFAVFSNEVLIQGGSSWSDIIGYLYARSTNSKLLWNVFQPDVDYLSLILSRNIGSDRYNIESGDGCLQLFISGDRSSVGKSTVSLMLLASLVGQGVPPDQLAYIKPVTQCEAVQPVSTYCHHVGIATMEISPVIFYQGFTRAYLNGETETAEQMLHRIRGIIRDLSVGKKLVVIDGVGYPSVGSICSISNADVAQFLQAPVLLIGRPGVGDAVDSYNLLSAFFEIHGVRVLGCIFNKLELEGFYSLENCRTAIMSYFSLKKPHQLPYGFMPKFTQSRGLEHIRIVDEVSGKERIDLSLLSSWVELFLRHVDLQRIVFGIWTSAITKTSISKTPSMPVQVASSFVNSSSHQMRSPPNTTMDVTPSSSSISPTVSNLASTFLRSFVNSEVPNQNKLSVFEPMSDNASSLRLSGMKRSREEIEAASRSQGAERKQ
jgi:dethiobiotin synthetase